MLARPCEPSEVMHPLHHLRMSRRPSPAPGDRQRWFAISRHFEGFPVFGIARSRPEWGRSCNNRSRAPFKKGPQK